MHAVTLAAFAATAGLAAANPFFVFDNGLHGKDLRTIEAKLDLVKQVGFDGLSWRTDDPENVRKLLDGARARGLTVPVLYTNLDIKDGVLVRDPRLDRIIALCKDSGTMIWPNITSKQFPCSDPAGDAIAVAGLRDLAGLCEANGLKIALYPHVNMWLHRIDDALRVAGKVDRKNVGVTFNLCHVLLDGAEARIPALVTEAAPRLFVATINGADSGVTNGDLARAIQPLGRGNLDVRSVLAKLRAAGFQGPVGLQCFKIEGDPKDLLPASMSAWRKMADAP